VDVGGDEDQGTVGSLLLVASPVDNGKCLLGRPLNLLLHLTQLFQLHGETTLADFIVGELLQVRGETKLGGGPDEPLGRVILVPLDGVTEVHRELMVEVVVALSNGDESGDDMITGRVLVIERAFAEPVRKRVDAECGLRIVSE
jgi:hypothetical protein